MGLDYDITKLAKAPEHSSDGVFPIFHHEIRRDHAASENAGKAIYEAVPYVEIVCPGNDKEQINRRVKETDKERWPDQWRAFEEGRKAPEFDGMPITEWPQADRHLARTLKESNVFTVEQLANVADIDIQMLGPGMMNLKNLAIKWVKNKSGESEALKKKDEQISILEEKLIAFADKEPEVITEYKTEIIVEVVVKSGGWYTYKGKKCREADLPEHVRSALKESEE